MMNERQINAFRQRTCDDKLQGVTQHNFVCKRCKQVRCTRGRQPVVKGTNKYGYYCAQCLEKK